MQPDNVYVRTLLHTFVERSGGQKAAAIKLGCSPQFVGQLVHGKRNVPPTMARKLERMNGKK